MVPVLDTKKKPLAPTPERRARLLLKNGKAAVFRRFPFTIILKREIDNPVIPDLRLKIDPGSKATGLAILNQSNGQIVFAAELSHHGQAIKSSLDSRRAVRKSRRNRKTRYRAARFDNRTRPKGWLAPSIQSRVDNVETWAKRLIKFYPVSAIAMELVRFDMQLVENPEIKGVEYQQGELAGFEVKEYLLIKFGHECVYKSKGTCNDYLEVEHIVPRSRGGSNRVSNLTISCQKHNQEKGNLTAEEFGFPGVQSLAKKPLKDAAAVNTTRWALLERLKGLNLPVETGSGGLTKFNRVQRELTKTHWIDAACVGKSTPEKIEVEGTSPLLIKATGHGSRQMCRVDRFGFPRTSAKGQRVVKGFKTGDIVRAVVTSGKRIGIHIGRVAIRSRGSFNISTATAMVTDVSWRYCKKLHSSDGYGYQYNHRA